MVVQAPEFAPARLQSFVENLPPARQYLLASLMPEKTVTDINFAFNVISGAYAPAASITGWNSPSPLRDKQTQAKEFGSVAKLHHSYFFDEVELFVYNLPRTPEEREQVVADGQDRTKELSDGVEDTKEYLRAQIIYKGGLTYSDEEGKVVFDFKIDRPEGNVMDAITPWSDPASTPLTDIQNGVKQFKATNSRRSPALLHLTSVTESYLLQNEQIRRQAYGANNTGQILTPEDVQRVLRGLKLPEYTINDDVINLHGEEIQLLEDNKIVLLGTDLGNTMIGPAAERGYTPGKFAKTIEKVDPPSEQIIVGQTAFPALKRWTAVVTMDV